MSLLNDDIASRDTTLSDLDPETTALLVIDMSRDFIAPGAPMECVSGRAMAPHLATLVDHCRSVGVAIIYVNHVHQPGAHDMGSLGTRFESIRSGKALRSGSLGVELWDEVAPKPGDIIVNKIRQSGFVYTSLEAVLRELAIETVLVSGVSTGACVECTARDAVARDFNVVLLSDATSATDLPDLGWGPVDLETLKRVFLTNFAYHFGRVATIRDVIAAMPGTAAVTRG